MNSWATEKWQKSNHNLRCAVVCRAKIMNLTAKLTFFVGAYRTYCEQPNSKNSSSTQSLKDDIQSYKRFIMSKKFVKIFIQN